MKIFNHIAWQLKLSSNLIELSLYWIELKRNEMHIDVHNIENMFINFHHHDYGVNKNKKKLFKK
jgi:hypothetical protein